MRKSSLITFAFTAAVATTSMLHAQSNAQDFPWRSGLETQPVIHPDLKTNNVREGRGAMPNVQADETRSPMLQSNKLRSYLVSFGKQENQDLGDAQPSVSDLSQESVAPVAPQLADPSTSPVPQSVVQPPNIFSGQAIEPVLSVVSNATADETDYCARNCKRDWCNLGCERKLFGTTPGGLEIGGWTAVGYHNRNTIMLNNRKGEVNLDQTWLYMEKAASQDCPGWDFGFRADLVYGIDGQDIQAFGNPPAGAPAGWDNSWDYGSYGWAFPQLYLQVANDKWDIKLGKFFAPFGYEAIAAKDNFFYSHSYTMYYTEPYTMSGGLGERKLSDRLSTIIGFTAGWNTGFDNDTGGCLITGTRFRPNENVDIALTTCWGDRGRNGVGGLTSGVAQLQLADDLKYVFQADVLNFGVNNEFGIVQYLFRDLTECVALGTRLEWWKSDQLYPDTKSTYEFTMGANLKPDANITIRPEVRWDWGAAAIDPGEAIVGLDILATF